MPRMRFEPTISVFEQAKTINTLDRVVNVIGMVFVYLKHKVVPVLNQLITMP
jgi:hypothetical protein